MKVVLDSNVVLSGLFFGGIPGRILAAWHEGRLQLVVSPAILAEYRRVGAELAAQYEGVDFEPFATLLAVHAEVVDAPDRLSSQVSADPDDDKFLACALAAQVSCIVSGDPHLLHVSPWRGIEVLKPRAFADRYLGADRTWSS